MGIVLVHTIVYYDLLLLYTGLAVRIRILPVRCLMWYQSTVIPNEQKTNIEIMTKKTDTFANLDINFVFTNTSSIDVTILDKKPCVRSGGMTRIYGSMLRLLGIIL